MIDRIFIDNERFGTEVVDKAGNNFAVNPMDEPFSRDLISSNIPVLTIIKPEIWRFAEDVEF